MCYLVVFVDVVGYGSWYLYWWLLVSDCINLVVGGLFVRYYVVSWLKFIGNVCWFLVVVSWSKYCLVGFVSVVDFFVF